MQTRICALTVIDAVRLGVAELDRVVVVVPDCVRVDVPVREPLGVPDSVADGDDPTTPPGAHTVPDPHTTSGAGHATVPA